MLKHSQFNHIAEVPDTGEWALVNFERNNVERLDALNRRLFDMAPDLPPDMAQVAYWKAAGFLVDDDVDEVGLLRERVTTWVDECAHGSIPTSLEIVVNVTSACNFACPYCFQERRGGHMPQEVQEALVQFVESRLATGRYDHLGIEWFGGEPLLAPDIIDWLSARFMELSQAAGIGYDAMIHTNGYLLDQAMVDFLEARNVRCAVVTIDGMAEAHDATRYLHGGGPTFSRILGNLQAIRTSMFVNVRCNLHEGSMQRFDELCDVIEAIARDNNTNIRCSPSTVVPNSASAARGDTTQPITGDQYERALARSGLPLKMNAFRPVTSPCHIVAGNECIVDDRGDLFVHCKALSADSSRALGNVCQPETVDIETWDDAFAAFALKHCFPDDLPKCLECKILPCCMGVCVMRRLRGDDPDCPRVFADPDSYAIARYREAFGS